MTITQSTMAPNQPMKRNLRHHLRVAARMPATVATVRGDTLVAEIANVSRTGIMIECDREALETLHPRSMSAQPSNPIQAIVSFALPNRLAGKVAIQSPCSVVYARRLSRDRFHVGLEFKKLEEHLVPHLEDYIASHREG